MADNGFTGAIHELRSPLTSVLSLSEILQDYPEINGQKRREFLDIIIRETKRMTGIINRAEAPPRRVSDTNINKIKGGAVNERDQKQRLECNHGRAGNQSGIRNSVHLEYF